MTKQGKIREGIKTLVTYTFDFTPDEITDEILEVLHSQGVVRKIKCPDCNWSQFNGEMAGMTPCYSCNSTGYIYEPLIEEE